MPDLVRETGLPVALDESLVGMEPGALGDHRYAAAVVLKPTFLGGLSAALRFAGEASRLGMAPVVSSAYETGVGTAALVALAAAIGGGDAPAGLDTYRRLAADVVTPRLDLCSPVVEVRAACASHEVTNRYLELLG
jgi:o-succinylbenzoate synthase